MTFIFAFVILLVACVPYADLREYHYNRPQTPFHIGQASQAPLLQQPYAQPQASARYYAPAAPPPTQSTIASALVQNYGFAGTAHIARQLPQGANGYLPPHHQSSNGAIQTYYNQPAGSAPAAASYYPQQGQHYHTPNVNPLTQYSHQQQQPHSRYVNQPQPQQQYSQHNYANGQQNHHGAFGAANGHAGFGGGAQTLPLDGKYVSQSEAGQLHSYQHQQQPVGDTRPFARKITTCYPNGQCEHVTLGAGQPDKRHQHVVAGTRARAVPASDKCRQIKEANKAQEIANQYGAGVNYGGNSYPGGPNQYGAGSSTADSVDLTHGRDHDGPQNRPRDRRLFPYSEVVLPNDPYN